MSAIRIIRPQVEEAAVRVSLPLLGVTLALLSLAYPSRASGQLCVARPSTEALTRTLAAGVVSRGDSDGVRGEFSVMDDNWWLEVTTEWMSREGMGGYGYGQDEGGSYLGHVTATAASVSTWAGRPLYSGRVSICVSGLLRYSALGDELTLEKYYTDAFGRILGDSETEKVDADGLGEDYLILGGELSTGVAWGGLLIGLGVDLQRVGRNLPQGASELKHGWNQSSWIVRLGVKVDRLYAHLAAQSRIWASEQGLPGGTDSLVIGFLF